jgi:hypothetical protein
MNTYKYITTAANYLLAGNETNRVIIECIQVNKTLVGTLTIKAGGASGTTIGVIAAGTLAGTYWQTNLGIEVENPCLTNSSSSDDITVFYRNA